MNKLYIKLPKGVNMYCFMLLFMLYVVVIPLFIFLLYKVNYLGINKSAWTFNDFYNRYLPLKIYNECLISVYFIVTSGTLLWMKLYCYLKNNNYIK